MRILRTRLRELSLDICCCTLRPRVHGHSTALSRFECSRIAESELACLSLSLSLFFLSAYLTVSMFNISHHINSPISQ